MKSVTIKLTATQKAEIMKLREGKDEPFWILGQAYIEPNRGLRPIGTAEFHYCNEEQGQMINSAVKRARNLYRGQK